MKKAEKISNIVIMRTDRIGEVLLSTVAVDAIRTRYPDVRITFVTSEYSRPVVSSRDDIEDVIIADTMKKGALLGRSIHLAKVLRKKRFDIALVMNPHKMLHLACFLAGIPIRAGYDRKWSFLLTDKIKDDRDSGSKHEVEYAMDLLHLLDVNCDVPDIRLPVRGENEDKALSILYEKNMDEGKPLICVHPASSNPAKIWPGARYAELIRKISTELDCNVAVLGSREEKSLVEDIIRTSGVRVLNLSGELELEELAAVLKNSVLFIGNDTGPMHMAAALGTTVIAIFGRSIPGVGPKRWRPLGDKHIVFHEDPGCRECHDTRCPYDYRCLRKITVNAVFDAAEKVILNR